MNAELERAYDQDPYPGYAFWFTHPDHLGMMGRLFGLGPAHTDACKVLEIGCAIGGNLLPMAASAPGSRFVGVDLSGVQIALAREAAAAAEIANVTFVHGDFRDVPEALGPFDYIICHGVFSWVTPETQRAILRFIRERLSPRGIGYVSYNTYPGHHMVDGLRKLFSLHTAGAPTPEAKIEQAFSIATWLHRRSKRLSNDWRTGFYERELDAMSESGRSLLLHDYCASENHPMYFVDFVKLAGEEGLAYLANTDPWDIYLENHDPEIVETLSALGDMVLQQQYLDFVYNVRFRRTMICRADAPLTTEVRAEHVFDFFLGAALSEEPSLDGLAERLPIQVFITSRPPLTVSSPVLRLALYHLHRHRRHYVSFDRLFDEVATSLAEHGLEAEALATEEGRLGLRGRLAGQLLRAFFADAVRFTLRPPPVAETVPERPATGRYQRWLATQPRDGVVNFCHEVFVQTPASRAIMPLLDGTRTQDELAAHCPEPIGETLENLRLTGFILDPSRGLPIT